TLHGWTHTGAWVIASPISSRTGRPYISAAGVLTLRMPAGSARSSPARERSPNPSGSHDSRPGPRTILPGEGDRGWRAAPVLPAQEISYLVREKNRTELFEVNA